MLDNLKNIISKSALDASGSIGRYYYFKVPQNTDYPYATYYLLVETYGGKDTGNLYGDVTLQFNIFSDYKDYGAQCNTIMQEILDYYDNSFASFANTNGVNVISINRNNTLPARYDSQNDVWQATIEYSIHVLN